MNQCIENMWRRYVDAERLQIKSESKLALTQFIDALLALPDEERPSGMLRTLSLLRILDALRQATGEASEARMRFPLLQRVVFPALVEGVKIGEPGCARRLASLWHQLVQCPEAVAQMPANLQNLWGLLEEAIRVDPTDDAARKQLAEEHGAYISYTLHETYYGVLYESNGATVVQMDELISLLEGFQISVGSVGLESKYAELIEKARFHYYHYRDYLLSDGGAGSYSDYVASGDAQADH